MFIVAEHNIKNPEAFFRLAPEILKARPGARIVQSLPNMSNDRAICLWEAHSVEDLKAFLDPLIGDSSRNAYYEVDNTRATGLPTATTLDETEPRGATTQAA